MVEKTKNNFRFPGQYYIEETGLYYNWNRWYNKNIGRYYKEDISVIELDILDEIDVYNYVSNNPILFFDDYGLKKKKPGPKPKPNPEPKNNCKINCDKERWDCILDCRKNAGCPEDIRECEVNKCTRKWDECMKKCEKPDPKPEPKKDKEPKDGCPPNIPGCT